MLWQLLHEHAPDLPFGWIQTAEVRQDGLWIEGYMDATTSEARKAFQRANNGEVNGLSIGFKVIVEHLEGSTRVLDKIEIVEVSVGAARNDER